MLQGKYAHEMGMEDHDAPKEDCPLLVSAQDNTIRERGGGTRVYYYNTQAPCVRWLFIIS
jgi:hypothetical protein